MDEDTKRTSRTRAREVLETPKPTPPTPSNPSTPPQYGAPIIVLASVSGALVTLVLLGIVGFAETFGGLTLAGATIVGGAISGAVTAILRKNDHD